MINEILTVFQGRDLRDLSWAVGAKISRNRVEQSITISQTKKVQHLLGKFCMVDSGKAFTPLQPRQHLRSAKDFPFYNLGSVLSV